MNNIKIYIKDYEYYLADKIAEYIKYNKIKVKKNTFNLEKFMADNNLFELEENILIEIYDNLEEKDLKNFIKSEKIDIDNFDTMSLICETICKNSKDFRIKNLIFKKLKYGEKNA